MNFRVVLCWLLALPMFWFLFFFASGFLGALILLALHGPDPDRIFFVAFTFLFLFCAHLLFVGSYYAHPSFYRGRLSFLRAFFRTPRFLLPLAVIYVVCLGKVFYNFVII